MANQYTRNKPPELAHVTYAQLEPIWEQLTELRDAVQALYDCTETVDACIAWERPTEMQVREALEAIDKLPMLAERLEAIMHPKLVDRLMRRCARLRGVKRRDYDKATGRARFG